jgi:hypothetical protein
MADKLSGWAGDTKQDVGEQSWLNSQLHGPRLKSNSNTNVRAMMQSFFMEQYGYNIQESGMPYIGTVLKVLSGPNCEEAASTGNLATTLLHAQGVLENSMVSDPKDPEGVLVRVIARIPEFDIGLNWPMDKEDFIRLCAHGEYVAVSKEAKFNDIKEGTRIVIKVRGEASPSDGKPAGIIYGIHSQAKMQDLYDVLPKPKLSFRNKCKSARNSSAPEKNIVGETEPNPAPQYPSIKKFKSLIKTGIYGNGTPQTKHHFDAALTNRWGPVVSSKYDVEGPAPGKDNAFIWVGHLRNNGYLDLLDRPIGLGRETIIYAPMTLNLSAPIELKYYFHDQGGFGHAWVNGPSTTTELAIDAADEDKNDFREKIAPGIKDLIKEGVNFILVIPEMAFSRGFGTSHAGKGRVKNMSIGKGVGYSSTSGPTLRTTIHPNTRAAVKEYLKGLPASPLITYDGGFLDLFDETGPLESVLQKTHLRERETVTFDGSFTGGLFSEFHDEVKHVINSHLGKGVTDNIQFTSILADGLGAVNLASIVKNIATSGVHNNAENSFKDVIINRIDFVENGQDEERNYNFSSTPSYAIYEDYLLERAEIPDYFEFNYITEGGSYSGQEFFKKIGKETLFLDSRVLNSNKGERKFSLDINGTPIASGESISANFTINMHLAPSSESDTTNSKVGYAFSMYNNFVGAKNILLTPDTSLSSIPVNDLVPDHAGIVASRPSEGAAQEYMTKQAEIQKQLENSKYILQKYALEYTDFCSDEKTKALCYTLSHPAPNMTKLKEVYISHLNNLNKFYVLEHKIIEEIDLAKIINDKSKLNKFLSDKNFGVDIRLEEAKKSNNDYDYYKNNFPESSFWSAVSDEWPPEPDFNINKAEKKLREGAVEDLLPDINTYAFFMGSSTGSPPGAYAVIVRNIAVVQALTETKEKIKNALDAMTGQEAAPPGKFCPQPSPLRIERGKIITPISFPSAYSSDAVGFSVQSCSGKDIRVVSSFNELKRLIPWSPKKNDLIAGEKRYSTLKTKIKEKVDSAKFQTKTFKYRSRSTNNTITYRESPPVWSCMAEKVRESWEAACNVSNYVPFRITYGITGEDGQPGITAYKNGVSVDSYGLSIGVDAPVAGYDSDGDPVYSIFTGMWTSGFVESFSEELYELGVLEADPTPWYFGGDAFLDAGSRYKDNAYQGFYERDLRLAENWDWAEDSYEPGGDKETQYEKIMDAAKGSPIVPRGADPVMWLLTFCEKSGMKWGNSFFLRKRYRGVKTGEFIGFDLRNDTPPAWSVDEQNRIAAIYGITDIVARINAISWSASSVDKHMHFQYYGGSPIITWKEIEESR